MLTITAVLRTPIAIGFQNSQADRFGEAVIIGFDNTAFHISS